MKRYVNTAILRQDSLSTGNAGESIPIRVFIAGSVTVEASLFSDAGGTTPIVQPFNSQASGGDMPGQFSFYFAGGLVDIYFNFGTGSVTSIKNQSISSEVSVKDFGAVGDGVVDDTAAIQAAEDSLSSRESLTFPSGTYKTTSGLNFKTTGAIYHFDSAVFSFGTSSGTAVTFGEISASTTIFDMVVTGSLKVQRTHDQTGTVPAATALTGIGVLFRNVGDMDTTGCYMYSVGFGDNFKWISDGAGCTLLEHGKMVAQNGLIDFNFEVASSGTSFLSQVNIYGARNVFNTAAFSDIVGTIGVAFGITASPLRDVDNVHLFGGGMESAKERKAVFDFAEGCNLLEAYWDPGALGGAGGFPLGGGVKYIKKTITGASVTAGSTTISATGHGMPGKSGDKIIVTSTDGSVDKREYIVGTGSDTNNIVVLTKFQVSSSANVAFTYYGTQIEFTTNATKCKVFNGAAIEQNVITDLGLNRNMIQSAHVGYQRGNAQPLSLDPTDLSNTESLMYLEASVLATDIFSYSVNAHPNPDSGVGHRLLGGVGQSGVPENYLLPMAGYLANPTDKTVSGITADFEIWTADKVGGYHLSYKVASDGITSTFGGVSGTERGELKNFTFQDGAAANNNTVTLPTGGYGILTASAGAEGATWIIQSDGSSTLIAGTTNTADTNTGSTLTAYKNGGATLVRNFLGSDQEMTVNYNYGV